MTTHELRPGELASRPPEAWRGAHRFAERLLRPIERFLHVQAASGAVLLLATVAALVWANSRASESYTSFWHAPITLGVGPWVHRAPVHFWINDGLMVIFFFVVGLEIRRELHEGELSEVRRAALPVAAAAGGMVVPAALFLAFAGTTASRRGWGVPMATDIAFAVGALALLGKRVPPAIRVLLLALAIIDDIGAIVVIALFYSAALAWQGFVLAAIGVAVVLLMQRFGVRRALLYVAPGFVVWLGVLRAGVHPTIAGVALGLLTPARAWFGPEGFVAVAGGAVRDIRDRARDGAREQEIVEPLSSVAAAHREAVSPVVRLQTLLHPWVAFVIMPLFALANAGVRVSGLELGGDSWATFAGIVVGLVVGKPLGIVLASALAVRLGIAKLPRGVTLRGVALVGLVAGIGFTMALFIAELAFADAAALPVAKLAVLVASGTAAVLGITLGATVLTRGQGPAGATSEFEAETADDV